MRLTTSNPVAARFRHAVDGCRYSGIAYQSVESVRLKHRGLLAYYDGLLGNNRDAQAYMFKDRSKLSICFRGTSSFNDLRDVMDMRHATVDIGGLVGAHMHSGFYEQFRSIESKLSRDMKAVLSSDDASDIDMIHFTGHSMGAAIALLAAAHYRHTLPGVHVSADVFGVPTFSDVAFADLIRRMDVVVYNMEHDVVPLIPVHRKFVHVPGSVELSVDGIAKCRLAPIPTTMIRFCRKLSQLGTMDKVVMHHSAQCYSVALNHMMRRLYPNTDSSTR